MIVFSVLSYLSCSMTTFSYSTTKYLEHYHSSGIRQLSCNTRLFFLFRERTTRIVSKTQPYTFCSPQALSHLHFNSEINNETRWQSPNVKNSVIPLKEQTFKSFETCATSNIKLYCYTFQFEMSSA